MRGNGDIAVAVDVGMAVDVDGRRGVGRKRIAAPLSPSTEAASVEPTSAKITGHRTVQETRHGRRRRDDRDLEPGKWAKLNGWGDVGEAKSIIVECIERVKKVGF